MNRVTITLNPDNSIRRICADEPVQVFTVCPHTPRDRVYLYGAVEVGSQFVQEEIGGHPVGHLNDGTAIGIGLVGTKKLPPSTPDIREV
jgi:hypothetical protein